MASSTEGLKITDLMGIASMANGRIKAIDLTKDMLADFETYKKQAEALYGTDQDPYKADPAGRNDIVLVGIHLTDADPAEWAPQWINEDGNPRPVATKVFSDETTDDDDDTRTLMQRMQTLFAVNDQRGPEQSRWSQRVLQDWFARHAEAAAGIESPSAASQVAANRTYGATASA